MLKPLKKSRSVPVLQEISGLALTSVADELLLSKARTMSEGSVERNGTEDAVYYGSTLVTIDLESCGLALDFDNGDIDRLVYSLKRSVMAHVRLMRLARREAEARSSPYLLRGMTTKIDFGIEGKKLLVDIDVRCPLEERVSNEGDAEGGVE